MIIYGVYEIRTGWNDDDGREYTSETLVELAISEDIANSIIFTLCATQQRCVDINDAIKEFEEKYQEQFIKIKTPNFEAIDPRPKMAFTSGPGFKEYQKEHAKNVQAWKDRRTAFEKPYLDVQHDYDVRYKIAYMEFLDEIGATIINVWETRGIMSCNFTEASVQKISEYIVKPLNVRTK